MIGEEGHVNALRLPKGHGIASSTSNEKWSANRNMAVDIKTLVTVFLGIWTLVIVCIVVGMYATWEANMIESANDGRGNQGTTEALGNFKPFLLGTY